MTTPYPDTIVIHVPVEDIVLQHEEDVKYQTEQSEAEFRYVTKEGDPVLIVVRIEHHLENR